MQANVLHAVQGRVLVGVRIHDAVAIARSFMRLTSRGSAGADLLILDEPTASIDAQAECELFERFKRLTQGRSAIIISHRFSTVPMPYRSNVRDFL